MSVPDWLSDSIYSPGDYTESLSDVATILTTVKDKLVTNGNWSLLAETPGTLISIKTPVRASGSFMTVLLTKIDANTIQFTVADLNGTSIRSGRIDIAAAGNTTVDYYWGNYYLIIIAQVATPEVMQAYLLDESATGGTEGDHLTRVVAQFYRDTAGTALAIRIATGSLYALDNGVSAIESRIKSWGRSLGVVNAGLIGAAGRLLFFPAICIIQISSVYYHVGALPMCFICDQSMTFGAVKQLPVDVGTSRAFVVLPLTTTANDGMRLMIRKPSQDA